MDDLSLALASKLEIAQKLLKELLEDEKRRDSLTSSTNNNTASNHATSNTSSAPNGTTSATGQFQKKAMPSELRKEAVQNTFNEVMEALKLIKQPQTLKPNENYRHEQISLRKSMERQILEKEHRYQSDLNVLLNLIYTVIPPPSPPTTLTPSDSLPITTPPNKIHELILSCIDSLQSHSHRLLNIFDKHVYSTLNSTSPNKASSSSSMSSSLTSSSGIDKISVITPLTEFRNKSLERLLYEEFTIASVNNILATFQLFITTCYVPLFNTLMTGEQQWMPSFAASASKEEKVMMRNECIHILQIPLRHLKYYLFYFKTMNGLTPCDDKDALCIRKSIQILSKIIHTREDVNNKEIITFKKALKYHSTSTSTASAHCDYEHPFKKVKEVSKRIDAPFLIDEGISGGGRGLHQQRQLIYSGKATPLWELTSSNGENEYMFYLFTDVLVYAARPSSSSSKSKKKDGVTSHYTFQSFFYLTPLLVFNLFLSSSSPSSLNNNNSNNNGANNNHLFQIISQADPLCSWQPFTLSCESEADKQDWMRHLRSAILSAQFPNLTSSSSSLFSSSSSTTSFLQIPHRPRARTRTGARAAPPPPRHRQVSTRYNHLEYEQKYGTLLHSGILTLWINSNPSGAASATGASSTSSKEEEFSETYHERVFELKGSTLFYCDTSQLSSLNPTSDLLSSSSSSNTNANNTTVGSGYISLMDYVLSVNDNMANTFVLQPKKRLDSGSGATSSKASGSGASGRWKRYRMRAISDMAFKQWIELLLPLVAGSFGKLPDLTVSSPNPIANVSAAVVSASSTPSTNAPTSNPSNTSVLTTPSSPKANTATTATSATPTPTNATVSTGTTATTAAPSTNPISINSPSSTKVAATGTSVNTPSSAKANTPAASVSTPTTPSSATPSTAAMSKVNTPASVSTPTPSTPLSPKSARPNSMSTVISSANTTTQKALPATPVVNVFPVIQHQTDPHAIAMPVPVPVSVSSSTKSSTPTSPNFTSATSPVQHPQKENPETKSINLNKDTSDKVDDDNDDDDDDGEGDEVDAAGNWLKPDQRKQALRNYRESFHIGQVRPNLLPPTPNALASSPTTTTTITAPTTQTNAPTTTANPNSNATKSNNAATWTAAGNAKEGVSSQQKANSHPHPHHSTNYNKNPSIYIADPFNIDPNDVNDVDDFAGFDDLLTSLQEDSEEIARVTATLETSLPPTPSKSQDGNGNVSGPLPANSRTQQQHPTPHYSSVPSLSKMPAVVIVTSPWTTTNTTHVNHGATDTAPSSSSSSASSSANNSPSSSPAVGSALASAAATSPRFTKKVHQMKPLPPTPSDTTL